MEKITVKSAAKLNLTFDITGIRPDGYHDVETIFQSVDLCDTLVFDVRKAPTTSITITCENPYVKRLMGLDDANLITKAARAFLERAQVGECKVDVQLEKHIPIGAGLAGGSSNAAATLVGLNEIFGKPLTNEQLLELGLAVGSDVPFCLTGGTMIGRGRGELLEKIDSKLELIFCLVKPRKLSVSTPWAYKAFDLAQKSKPSKNGDHECKESDSRKPHEPNLGKALAGMTAGELELSMEGFGNVFEPVVLNEYPELASLKEWLLDMGAWYCQMTGSGPTLFAIVPSREMAHHLRRSLLNDDELGFFYGTEEVMNEGLPPIDFRIAGSCSYGLQVV